MKDLERLAMEPVQSRQRIGRVECAQAAIEAAPQRFPLFQVAGREPAWQGHSVGLEFSKHRFPFDLEGTERRAKIARSRAGDPLAERGERDEGRNASSWRQETSGQRAQGRVIERGAGPVARGHVGSARAVCRDRVAQRADQGAVVHHLRQHRHVLGDRDARGGSGDRPELAANLLRRFGLQIPDIDRRGPTRKPELNHPGRRLSRAGSLAGGLGPEHLRKRQAQQPGGTSGQEVTAMKPFAIGPDSRHGGRLPKDSVVEHKFTRIDKRPQHVGKSRGTIVPGAHLVEGRPALVVVRQTRQG